MDFCELTGGDDCPPGIPVRREDGKLSHCDLCPKWTHAGSPAQPPQAFHPVGQRAESCATCRLFGSTPPAGIMPGVTEAHRKCNKQRASDGPAPWRNPADWCDAYVAREMHEPVQTENPW